MKTPTKALLAIAALFLSAETLQAQLQPVLLFKDTFNVTGPTTDLSTESGTRQTGTVAPLTFTRTGVEEGVQLGADDAPGMLRISNGNVALDHNFTEGAEFSIDFDLNPGIDDSTSTDWIAVIFGATGKNPFVNASDGMGILFRNNGQIEVWDGGARVSGGPTDLPGGIPTAVPFHVRIEVETADFQGSPATIRMFINGTQVGIGATTLEHVKTAGFRNNHITFMSIGAWVHGVDNVEVSAVPCVEVAPSFVSQVRGQTTDAVTVTIPAELNTGKTAVISVTSSSPAVAVPTGADPSGRLNLTFAANGPRTQTFTVTTLASGQATMQLAGEAGLCIKNSVHVSVAAGTASTELVFRDTFDTSAPSWDVNFENNLRQTGSAAPLAYTEPAANAAGGAADEFTAVNEVAPGQLSIINVGTGVSPDYNFIDGPEFTIEFDLVPGLDFPAFSDNWAAIAFGASTRNAFVNGGDGMGILFRNDGRIEVWDGGTRVTGSTFETAFTVAPLRVKIEAVTSDFHGGSPATVRMSVNDTPVQIGASTMEHVKAAGFRGNYITLAGIGAELVHAFDNLRVTAEACVSAQPTLLTFAPGVTTGNVVVKIPAALNTGKSATVRLTSRNPAIASLQGAVNGVVTLTFAAGASTTQTVQVTATGKGQTFLDLSNDSGACVSESVAVSVSSGLVKNPSFEENFNPAWPHYSSVNQWVGGSGVNEADGPFHDNGVIPDRNRVGFMQGAAVFSQTINGLEPGKKYWLQFRYNSRNGPLPDLTVRFDGADLDVITGISQVGAQNSYYSRNVVFIPTASSGLLEFAAANPGGDSTVLLDAVTVVQRDDGNVVVMNPSFEASGAPTGPGYIQPRGISGWTGTGNYGVNFTGAGPFADNGTAPEQDYVAFIEGAGSLTQRINGLITGEEYTVRYAYNAQNGTMPHLKVSANEIVLQDEMVMPVGGSAPYSVKSATFTATDSFVVLKFEQTAAGNQVVLLDNVQVLGEALVIPPIKLAPFSYDLDISQSGSIVTVTIPAELTASSSATITVTSQNPAVAIPTGAVNGVLDLVFAAGGAELEKTFTITPVGNGATAFRLSNRVGAQFENDTLNVSVSSSHVRNPSFEANSQGGVGYGNINAWTGNEGGGNTGINTAAGPFHDNGVVPDRAQVALFQPNGEKTVTQTIFRLIPNKQYWLQFYYNARNCCGGALDLAARFGGTDLTYISTLTPVGGTAPYNFANVPFTPTTASEDLQFAIIQQGGDASALLDAVSIVQRDDGNIVLQNPSFEASGTTAFPGYVQPRAIAGWTMTGQYGVNVGTQGPFANNGRNPDQDNVLFLQSANSSASQTVGGLTPGNTYTLSYAYNARSGNSPRLVVTVNGAIAQDQVVAAIGGTTAYPVHQYAFAATGDTAEVKFTQAAEGDQTVLIDNVMIVPGGTVVEQVRLSVAITTSNVRLSWPESATGYVLQSSGVLPANWTGVTQPEVIGNGERSVTLPIGTDDMFFRLIKRP